MNAGTAAQPTSVADLDALIIFPKLYRRLVDYFTNHHTGLAAFDTWIRPAATGQRRRSHLHSNGTASQLTWIQAQWCYHPVGTHVQA